MLVRPADQPSGPTYDPMQDAVGRVAVVGGVLEALPLNVPAPDETLVPHA